MKKNIGFIPMDFVLEEWLLEKLIKEPPKSDCAEDLLSGGSFLARPVGRDADWRTGNQS